MTKTITSTPGSVFEWIDVIAPTEEELNGLAVKYNLPHTAVVDCLQPEHLPKFEQFENYSFIITRYYDINCHAEADNLRGLTRKLAIFYNDKSIITIHRGEAQVVYDIAERHRKDTSSGVAFNIICELVKRVLNTFEDPILKLDHDVEHYESRIFLHKHIPDLLKIFYLIKRQSGVYKRTLILSKPVVDQIGAGLKNNPHFEDLKDYHMRIEVLNEEVFESMGNLMHIYISLSSQKTNEVMRILTVFSAFFLPLTFIVGVYGMNFEFMPELKYKYGYPIIMGLMLAVTMIIFQWFKRKKWI